MDHSPQAVTHLEQAVHLETNDAQARCYLGVALGVENGGKSARSGISQQGPGRSRRWTAGPAHALQVRHSVPREAASYRKLESERRFVFGMYRRHMKTIGYLGKIEKLFGVPETTRNWNTILSIVRILKVHDKKAAHKNPQGAISR